MLKTKKKKKIKELRNKHIAHRQNTSAIISSIYVRG